MTKEEMKQEAEIFAKTEMSHPNEYGMYYYTFLKVAEPREKRIAELEDKLANADYQLEGRDIKIKELEAQIEKMKCWCNCKNYLSCLEDCCRKNISFEKGICYNCKKWELRR